MKLFSSNHGQSEPISGLPELPFPKKSCIRRCVTTVSGLTLSAVSSLALSLGLGDMEAKSYLGQPLEAEIALVSLDRSLDLDTVIVRQVPAAEAEAMGVDVSYTPYRFELMLDKSSGNPRVSVSSDASIREPYLNLLVELRWPSGVVYREYPLLLDPPPAVNTPELSPRQVREQQPAEQRPQNTSAQAAAPQIELPPLQTDNGTYQVQPGDSLSRIAERWREGTSQGINETMQWLYENNPQAFARGDIDQLRAGAVLQMPDLTAYRLGEQRATEVSAKSSQSPSVAPARGGEVAAVDVDAQQAPAGRVGQDAARAESAAGLVTVGAANRDDRTREMIDLLVRENESLRQRVEKLENSEYLDTLKQLIVLQRQQIADLRSELGIADGAVSAEMDSLLAEVGVDLSQATAPAGSAEDPANDTAAALTNEPVQVAETTSDGTARQAAGPVNVETPAQSSISAEEGSKNWFTWFVIAAGVLLAGLFAAMYAYYRRLVPVQKIEDEYADILAPLDDEEGRNAPVVAAAAESADDTINYGAVPEPIVMPSMRSEDNDWMGEKASRIDSEEEIFNSEVEDVQRTFEDISLDEDALANLDRINESSLEAITGEMPAQTDERTSEPKSEPAAKGLSEFSEPKEKPARRPDEEVKMSIAEKMSQYNPEEYRQELESLGFLELDELVDLDESEEDEVEAVVYRAMMFCEFKKFDKALDLIESKLVVTDDERLHDALAQVNALRKEASGSKKVG